MKKRKSLPRAFECTVCKERAVAYKRAGHFTGAGHIKTMYCWKCKKVVDFKQLPKYEL